MMKALFVLSALLISSASANVLPRSLKESLISRSRSFVNYLGGASAALLATSTLPSFAADEGKRQFEYQPALQGLDYGKPRTNYPDYTQSKTGLQYKTVKVGEGKSVSVGDRVVLDWEGYTIGYYGRPFEKRGLVKGGAFDAVDEDYFRFIVGSGTAIAAVDEGVRTMKEGGITQIIVPAELGYPKGDSGHDLVGPKPSTFSGMRALNFVLDNQNLIDKTLLINVRLVRVDKDFGRKNKV